jgi:deoxyribose-phosphate aldolase
MNIDTLTEQSLAKLFDHTLVKAPVTEEMMAKICSEAKELNVCMAAINPYWVPFCKKQLEGTDIHVGAAIGFPLGQNTTAVKVFECEDSLKNGADEIDYMINLSDVKDGHWDAVESEMQQLTDMSHKYGVPCKVILETCYLEDDQIVKICEIAKKTGIDYVKTSTGMGPGGATVHHVKLMKDTVGDAVKVKASGGIRSWADCKAMLEAGAERIGTSASVKILEEFKAEKNA